MIYQIYSKLSTQSARQIKKYLQGVLMQVSHKKKNNRILKTYIDDFNKKTKLEGKVETRKFNIPYNPSNICERLIF